jgi:hypothetical protein
MSESESGSLRPVIIAVVVYNVLVWALPQAFKQPVGVKAFDDMMMLVVSQKGMSVPGSLFVALIFLVTNYFAQVAV